jgi:hypothetical protein
LSKDRVLPKTGLYLHPTKLENGKVTLESVSYDYQSISDVFKHIVAQLVMEACAGIRVVINVYEILGDDHGIGAFRLPLRTLVVLQDDRHLKRILE